MLHCSVHAFCNMKSSDSDARTVRAQTATQRSQNDRRASH